jgi:hypothetical protein
MQGMGSCSKAGWPDALPTKGILCCQFACGRQQRQLPSMDERRLLVLVRQLKAPALGDLEKLGLVCACSGQIYMTCQQVGGRSWEGGSGWVCLGPGGAVGGRKRRQRQCHALADSRSPHHVCAWARPVQAAALLEPISPGSEQVAAAAVLSARLSDAEQVRND